MRTPVTYVHEEAPPPDGTNAVRGLRAQSVVFNTVHVERVRSRLREMVARELTWEEVAALVDHPQCSAEALRAMCHNGPEHENSRIPIAAAHAIFDTPIPPPSERQKLYPELADKVDKYKICPGIPIEEFYPEDKGEKPSQRARDACAACPVSDDCLELSFQFGRALNDGYLAGRTPRHRQRLNHVYVALGRVDFWAWMNKWEDTPEFTKWIKSKGSLRMKEYPR